MRRILIPALITIGVLVAIIFFAPAAIIVSYMIGSIYGAMFLFAWKVLVPILVVMILCGYWIYRSSIKVLRILTGVYLLILIISSLLQISLNLMPVFYILVGGLMLWMSVFSKEVPRYRRSYYLVQSFALLWLLGFFVALVLYSRRNTISDQSVMVRSE